MTVLRIFFLTCGWLFLAIEMNGQRKQLDSLFALISIEQPDTFRIDILNHIGYYYGPINTDSALYYSNEALNAASEMGYKRGLGMAHARVGSAYYYKAEDEKSLDNYLEALRISEEVGDSINLCYVYQGLGVNYQARKQNEKAHNAFEMALAIANDHGLDDRKTHAYLSLAITSLNADNVDQAYIYIRTSIQLSEEINYIPGIIAGVNFLATMDLEQGKYDEALKSLDRALSLARAAHNHQRTNYALVRKSRVHVLKGEYNKARAALNEAEEVIEGLDLISDEMEMYEDFFRLDTLVRNYEEALKHFMLYSAARDTIYNIANARQINELNTKYEAEKREREIELQQQQIAVLERDQQIALLWRYLLIGGIVGVIVIAVIVIYLQKIKAERDQKILNQEIEFKNKELASYTINFIQKQNLFEELDENLKEVEGTMDGSSGSKINRVRRMINQQNNIDKEWEDFKLYFESVHKDFFSTLKEKHPKISNADMKLSALIRLNMNIKESSAIMGISPDSVKIARYRLRKKLELETGVDLHEYISMVERSIA